jgi:adenylate cyclase
VRYVLEGSEQHSGNQVRVNAQLIDVETGAHLWADQFDADRGDLLKMQDEIVTRLARAMQIQLVAVDAARVTRTRPGNLDGEDLALRCQAALYNSVGPAEFAAAFSLCDRALNIDKGNVLALSILAMMHIIPVVEARSTDPQADIRQADELVSRALALDPNFYAAHFAKAYVLMGQNRTQEAVIEGERGLALNPSFIDAYVALCAANNFLGRPDRALELADKAIRLSPRDPFLRVLYHMKGWALFMKQQDDQAIEWLRRAEGGVVSRN